mgnify:CR=1 FL=1
MGVKLLPERVKMWKKIPTKTIEHKKVNAFLFTRTYESIARACKIGH